MKKKDFLLLIVAVSLIFGCSQSMSYCKRMQQESQFPIALDACQKCYDRFGEMDKEILIGCAIGSDVLDLVTE
ncbi:MAG: hypothetical protein GYA55_00625 [SAR324 cluster bacterium]|uniref:Lipoprotein n=1 Tax=SAR324 cluster bacterium TaxID=2024889 RepID=A0A7X9IJ38_9DELT|nr:hypothetical protein [SAR324 cluster bacterium]